ncbi:MAG: GLUG motif-containing protein [Gemmataceae bacterium]
MLGRIWSAVVTCRGIGALLFAASLVPFAGAQAAILISSAQTQNITCSGGTCTPTADDAVLNVSYLETLLASVNVTVSTTGSGAQADDIVVNAPFGWSSTNALSLDAYESITINRTVSIAGQSGLSLTTNDGGSGGTFSFGRKGHVVFQDISSRLAINGATYTLENSISTLAAAIAANPAGSYALANSYKASADGTYSESPIQTTFTGALEGLGNAISHLSVDASGYVGLFSSEEGAIENLGLFNINIIVNGSSWAGGIAAIGGNLSHVHVTGVIRGRGNSPNSIGGLVGAGGAITNCSANVRIIETQPSGIGGLVAASGNIDESYSTGSVSVADDGHVFAGALVAVNSGIIHDSYATGAVTGGAHSKIGGLVGTNGDGKHISPGTIETSYAAGAVAGGRHSKAGGFAGIAYKGGDIQSSYWDTTTSGTEEGMGKGSKRGITGLTTQQLQSGLPAGFDPTIWAENPNINGGLPYLIANPPQN